MGPECVWRFCPVSEGKAFLKLFFESLKKKKKTPTPNFEQEQSFRPAASRAGRRNGLLYSVFFHCAFGTLALLPPTRQSLFSDVFFFSRYICCCLCRHRDLCQDPFVASKTVREETGELIIDSAFFFFFATELTKFTTVVEWGIFFFFVQTSGSVGGETDSPQCQYFHCQVFWFGCLFYKKHTFFTPSFSPLTSQRVAH